MHVNLLQCTNCCPLKDGLGFKQMWTNCFTTITRQQFFNLENTENCIKCRYWMLEWDFSFDFHICQYNDLQGTVTGLKPGRCYEFEIVAISQEGESRPTKITDPVTTSESSSRPSPPLNVEVVEARNTSILLKWSQPLSDGNSPIIFYLIEKRDNAGSWSKAVQCSVQDLGVKVQFPHFFLF